MLDKIENIVTAELKFMKMSAKLDQEYAQPLQKEAEKTRAFAEVGVGVEGSVFLKDQPGTSIGFITDLAHQDYSSKIKTSSLDGAVDDAKGLCSLLNQMHTMGTHNDIKPANIVVLKDGSFKFIDFDGAKEFSSEETAEVLPSTRAFTRQEDYAALSDLDMQLNPARCLDSIKRGIIDPRVVRTLAPLAGENKKAELIALEDRLTRERERSAQIRKEIQDITADITNALTLNLDQENNVGQLKKKIESLLSSDKNKEEIPETTLKELLKSLDNYKVALSAKNSPEEKTALQQKRKDLSIAIDIYQMGVTLYLRCCEKGDGSGNFDVENFPYEIGSDQWPKGNVKEDLFKGKEVPDHLQELIRAMLTEDPATRISNYEAALEAFQSDSK